MSFLSAQLPLSGGRRPREALYDRAPLVIHSVVLTFRRGIVRLERGDESGSSGPRG